MALSSLVLLGFVRGRWSTLRGDRGGPVLFHAGSGARGLLGGGAGVARRLLLLGGLAGLRLCGGGRRRGGRREGGGWGAGRRLLRFASARHKDG